ncbi:Sybindin-like protein [Schizophyllum amplum]|uniref:Trafficking protein particle complex subunit n=1 Tax=Schizophyllum amplum TaxID=97359 RepID=A0A550CYP2_9AGAR|nr:Sybindin-like protein [Auriculariopsis ampla]
MTIHSLYIYDRHCACVYYQDWHRTRRPKPAADGGLLPGVCATMSASASAAEAASSNALAAAFGSPRNSLLSSSSGVVVAEARSPLLPTLAPSAPVAPQQPGITSTGLPFDEEAKLVYGVIISLRNMVKKLSGKDEQFTAYRTSAYRLHLFETASGYKFVMLSDPGADSLRFVMRQIYVGPFLDYVVRNPLVSMDSKEHGIDNEYFRMAVDRMVRGLSVFS